MDLVCNIIEKSKHMISVESSLAVREPHTISPGLRLCHSPFWAPLASIWVNSWSLSLVLNQVARIRFEGKGEKKSFMNRLGG